MLASAKVKCCPLLLGENSQAVGWVLSSTIADPVVGSENNPWIILAKICVAFVDTSATWKAC